MKIESFKTDPGFENKGKYGILHEGVRELPKGEQVYIGPLASCYGLIIPIETGGAIIAHIPPESRKMKSYFSQVTKLLQQLNPQQLKEAFLYSKEFKNDVSSQTIIAAIKHILETEGNIQQVRSFLYNNDLTYIILNTATKEIKAAPLNADLSPLRGISATTLNYE